jgi:hypothetical protein
MEALKGCMTKNKRLGRYDLKYNNFGDEAILQLAELLGEGANHVYEIEISERIQKTTLEEFRTKLAANKPKKGKKRKGKKKKKK